MSRKNRTATQESSVKRDLFTSKYRQRIVPDKSKYKRSRDKPIKGAY